MSLENVMVKNKDCVCGNANGTNRDCERCRFIAEIWRLRELLAASEQKADGYRRERDAAHHVIIEAGVVPVKDTHCECDECKSVLEGMQKAGYAR